MDIIFLYGLPGSGKLTVAKELMKYLGDDFRLFHNQMTVDLIAPIIPFPHPRGFELNSSYRLQMVDACMDLDINLIMTYVYAHKDRGDDEFINRLLNMADERGVDICFVHLVCDAEIVFRRIQNPDRKAHRKVMDPEKLKTSMVQWDLTSPIPNVDNLEIDTGITQVEDSAKIILQHFKLR